MTIKPHWIVPAAALVLAVLIPAASEAQLSDAGRVAQAVGRSVRITHADGSRATGTLVDISSVEVVVRGKDREQRLALVDVERVERVRHPARNGALWAAALAGGTAGALSRHLESDGPSDTVAFIAAWAAMAGAAGAGIGAVIGAVNRDDNVLYRTPRNRAFVTVAPSLSFSGAGVRLSMNW